MQYPGILTTSEFCFSVEIAALYTVICSAVSEIHKRLTYDYMQADKLESGINGVNS